MKRHAVLPLLALILCASSLAAQELVTVRRLSDVVGVREGSPPTERVLYYFEPITRLAQGDHIEQGSGGASEIILSAGGLVAMDASAHAILRRISANGDVIEFPLLTTLEARALDRPLSLALPGGTRCNLLNTEVYIAVEPGRMQIRNQGGMPITVLGDLLLRRGSGTGVGLGELRLKRGEEVYIPLFEVSGTEAKGAETELWGVLPVRHFGVAALERDGDRLHVSLAGDADADASGTVTVGGVATRPGTGRLLIRNPRHTEPPPAPVEALEPDVEPEEVVEEEAVSAETGMPDADEEPAAEGDAGDTPDPDADGEDGEDGADDDVEDGADDDEDTSEDDG
jgi:hypothetical protein